MFIWDRTMLLLIPAIIFGMIAKGKISRAYKKYSEIRSQHGWTAAQVARDLLDRNGLHDVGIQRTDRAGLSDHFDPGANVLRLSQGVYSSDSIAAIGIAAHEAGHAIQKSRGYFPLAMRNSILPAVNIGSRAAWPLFFIGLIFSNETLATVGIAMFDFTVAFQLITLPVEFDASKRAINSIGDIGYLAQEELQGAQDVLNAAALTYVAAAMMSVMQLLRLMSIVRGGSRRR